MSLIKKHKKIKINKRYFLSLSLNEKLQTLESLLLDSYNAYMIVAKYYLETPVRQGGLPSELVKKHFAKSVKRKYYLEKKKKKCLNFC
jgi:hypothetical protein|tara:strand:- start:1728 stop:1991 length:264 start_codon:yes stop_codon:yes gene_type:complete